jgi:hypothetical protein
MATDNPFRQMEFTVLRWPPLAEPNWFTPIAEWLRRLFSPVLA